MSALRIQYLAHVRQLRLGDFGHVRSMGSEGPIGIGARDGAFSGAQLGIKVNGNG